MQPPLIPGVARENLVKLLGVTFNNHLSFADHVRKLQIVASQRLYLLQLLKRQGLYSTCLDVVFKAIVLSGADKLRHPRSDAYSADSAEQVLLNKQHGWGGRACLHCYQPKQCCRIQSNMIQVTQ